MANSESDAQPQAAGQPDTPTAPKPTPLARPEPKGEATDPRNMDLILDIPMTVSVQLGSARMLIRDLLQLGQGSVVELEKLAGEPLDVLVNQKLVARGEVVVVNEKFGIRLTDVVSAVERVQQLN